MARRFLTANFRVVGSVRSPEKAESSRRELGSQFEPLIFDLQNEDEIANAGRSLERILDGQQLRILINNAGSAQIAPLLHVPLDEFRRQLDTLVVGQLAVIQRFCRYLLPSAPGDQPGRIINVSSVSGVNANPYFGCYAAGKHALEGLSKTLRRELQRYGIGVTVVAPGNIRTSIWSKQSADRIEPYRSTDYFEALQGLLKHINGPIVRNAMSAEEFAEALQQIALLKSPADRYTLVKARSRWTPFFPAKVRLIEK